MADFNIPDSVLETLRCFICKRYLSCAPVQVLPDGNSICSFCSTSPEHSATRQLTFEALLSTFAFPCSFKKYGCKERTPFGQTIEHEEKCKFRSFICPCLPTGSCIWQGPAVEIPDHFTKQHSSLVKEESEFKLTIIENKQEVFLVTFNDVPLLINYQYNSATSTLKYDIKYLTHTVQQAMCKIELKNDLDHNYNINLNSNFDNMQHVGILILNNFLQNLGNPDYISVTAALIIRKSNNKSETEKQLNVDYSLIDLLRCKGCRSYLVPPIYDCEEGVICSRCYLDFCDYKPSTNDKLKDRVNNANFPCQWRGCDVVEKGSNIKNHEENCEFRDCECTFNEFCSDVMKWNEVATHLALKHSCKFFLKELVYKTQFIKECYGRSFTSENNVIVLFKQNTYFSRVGYIHNLLVRVIGSSSVIISVKLVFEHNHCKVKSKMFTVTSSKRKYLTIQDLPSCFTKNEELTVTLKDIKILNFSKTECL